MAGTGAAFLITGCSSNQSNTTETSSDPTTDRTTATPTESSITPANQSSLSGTGRYTIPLKDLLPTSVEVGEPGEFTYGVAKQFSTSVYGFESVSEQVKKTVLGWQPSTTAYQLNAGNQQPNAVIIPVAQADTNLSTITYHIFVDADFTTSLGAINIGWAEGWKSNGNQQQRTNAKQMPVTNTVAPGIAKTTISVDRKSPDSDVIVGVGDFTQEQVAYASIFTDEASGVYLALM